MDDISIFVNSFDACFRNLELVLVRCEENNLMISWEKCHYMVLDDIVLGHRISKKGIKVDMAKVSAIEKLPPPTSVMVIHNFFGPRWFS